MPTSMRLLFLLAIVPGCLVPKTLDDTGADTDDTESGPSIFDVNDGTSPEDVAVTLEGVVVTSPMNRDGDGFFVADPDGGPNSGLFVWRQMGMADLMIYEGDELRITGTPSEFYGWMEFVVNNTEDIEVTGEADMPAPIELGDGAGVDWEEYESVLVTLEAQTIESIDAFNTATLSAGIQMDDGFVYNEYDCRGSYASVTGLIFFQYDEHSINARDENDLGIYTTPEPITTTVAAIQNGEVCGPVRIEGVVATTPSVEDEEGTSNFFVQDVGGGALSGVGVFTSDAVVTVATGDVLTLSGSADEFYDFTQLYLTDSPTELAITGSGAEPVVESLTEVPEEWEAYEGMLITLADVDVTSEASYGEVETSWSIKIDTLFYEHNAANGAHYTTVTGVVYYNYDEWKIEPRGASDLVE